MKKTKQKPSGYWTLERCIASAAKYKTRAQWRRNCSAARTAAQKNGWMKECCSHMTSPYKPKGYWNLKTCLADAKKYTTRTKWKKKSSSGYAAAQKNGWIDVCCKHMVKHRKTIK